MNTQLLKVVSDVGKKNILLSQNVQENSVSLNLTAPMLEKSESKGCDLMLVLDRSGSMSGDKLIAMKAATKEIVGYLGDKDRLGIITFSSDNTLDCELFSKGELLSSGCMKKIDGIHAEGSTYLFEALIRAKAVLNYEKNDKNKVILVMTDGAVNDFSEKEIAPKYGEVKMAIERTGISIKCLGLNLEKAQFFLDSLDSEELAFRLKISEYNWQKEFGRMFARILEKASNYAIINTKLQIKTFMNDNIIDVGFVSDNGTRLVPFKYGEYDIGNFVGGEEKKCIINIAINPRKKETSFVIGILQLTYQTLDGTTQSVEETVTVNVTNDVSRTYMGINSGIEKASGRVAYTNKIETLTSKVTSGYVPSQDELDKIQMDIVKAQFSGEQLKTAENLLDNVNVAKHPLDTAKLIDNLTNHRGTNRQ